MKQWVFIISAGIIACTLFFYEIKPNGNSRIISNPTYEDSFNVLQGSLTADWKYVSSDCDKETLSYYESLYEKNKHCQWNAVGTYKIPRVIHVIWIGPKSFPKESVETMRTWLAYHPDWTFVFWTDQDTLPPLHHMEVRDVRIFDFQYLNEQFKASNNWGEKSDLLRYEILYQYGGVYIDHDVKCLRAFDGLHTGYDFYSALEPPHSGIDGRSVTTGISILGSKPFHPVMKETLRCVRERWDSVTDRFSDKNAFIEAIRVVHRTLIAMTYACQNTLNTSENCDIVFPAAYFYPKNQFQGLYAEHLYATSWHDLNFSQTEEHIIDQLRGLKKQSQYLSKIQYLSLGLLLVIGVCLIWYQYLIRKIE